MAPLGLHNLANETWYLFGDTRTKEWVDLQNNYYVPPLDAGSDDPALAMGLGGRGSGVR